MGGADASAAGFYDAALHKREALMGKSGPAALIKNFRVFRIAAFACIGGVLYGYNQGMFSGVLAMPAFQKRMFFVHPPPQFSYLPHFWSSLVHSSSHLPSSFFLFLEDSPRFREKKKKEINKVG